MKIRNAIQNMFAYHPPLEGRNPNDYILLDFNESPVPPPQEVLDALTEFFQSGRVHVYPAYGDFLERLAQHCGRRPEQLILTNGSDQGIDIVLRAVLEAGDSMLLAKPGFAMFTQVAATLGVEVISPLYLPDMSYPFQAMLQSVRTDTEMIVIINPNNPTGSSITQDQLRQVLQTFPDKAVVVDEAYSEFTGITCLNLIDEYENLIVLKTFSKAFAIPSLRLGYVAANAGFIEQLYKIRGPYDVNMAALVAAEAVLNHPDVVQSVIDELMQKSKPLIESWFQQKGVTYFHGDANFMLVVPENVKQAIAFLKDNGILVRPMKPPIDHTFRMSLGTVKQMRQFINVFEKFLQQSA